MIKKILVFLVLLTGGFVALYALVDPQKSASANGEGNSGKASPPRDNRNNQGPGIPLETDGDKGTSIVAKPGGEVYLPKQQRIKMPSGSFRLVNIYILHAENSRTEPGNRLALEGVTIEFFKTNITPEFLAQNREIPKTATMTASKAVIELSRDENQVSQVADDKLMEFFDVVYSSGAEGGLRNTTVSVGHAHAINTEDMIHLWTPNRREPVRIESAGETGFVVTGEGLDAWVPSSRNEKGDVQVKAVGVKDITVLHNPSLVRADATLRSKGKLRLKEDSRTQTVLVTMRDSVEIVSRRSSSRRSSRAKKPGSRTFLATGERLRAILSRFETKDRSKMYWRTIDLHGEPAQLNDGQDIDLTCQHITVLPDTSGRPFWITAEGDTKSAPVMTHVVDGQTNTYRCAGKVHVIELRRQHGFFLQSYGIPGGLPPEFDQLILFDGKVSIDSQKDGLKMSSSRGIQMFRSANKELRNYVILQGQGFVRVTSAEIEASGNRGFLLHQRPAGEGKNPKLVRVFRLGPKIPDTSHRYDVRRLASKAKTPDEKDTPGFHIVGSGFCKIRMRDEIAEEAHLSSLAEDIDVTMSGRAGHLWQVRTLDAWFQPDGTPASFVAKGQDCRLEFETRDGIAYGRAEEIQHTSTDTYRLLGNLAEAKHKSYGTLRGRDIFIEQLSDNDVRLRASYRAELHMIALPEKKGTSKKEKPRDVSFTLRADEIRAEPFLIQPAVTRIHDHLFPRFAEAGMDSRYLFAKGKVTFEYRIEEAGKIDTGNGAGDELIIRSDREGKVFTEGRLTGMPAKIVSFDARGRETDAESHLVWFLHEKSGQFVTLHKVDDHFPVLRLLGLPQTQSGQPERMMLTCDGKIKMEPREIRCMGPVTARGLDVRGAIDPNGYMLDGKSMVMGRSEKGEVTSVSVTGDVVFRFVDAAGECDDLEIDLLQTILTARGTEKPAIVTTPSGAVHLSQVNYNYRTKMVETWKWRVLTKK
jgi:hypothetical protein